MSSDSPFPAPLMPAILSWSDGGTPMSTQFGDIYFSTDDGLSETRHVFLQHNGLPDRWGTHPRELFVIGETGFGTGLNFLAAWQAFRQWRAQLPATGAKRLHFISFEKFPLSRTDLAQALRHWPELQALADELVANYPYATPGCHRLLLDNGAVVLDLWFGDIQQTLDQLWHPPTGGLIDAWFLDGFAPSKNPEMWTDQLFHGLARLARPDATLATFTCAGFVRRGLNAAGFIMQKVKGHGSKREMLAGIRDAQSPIPGIARPCFSHSSADPDAPIHLIGGGIASATLALTLVRRGRSVTLWCADSQAAAGASGNRQGAIYPQLNGEQDGLSHWYSATFGFALRWYTPLLQRHRVAHDWCGVLLLPHDAKSRRKLTRLSQSQFPDELLRVVQADQLSELAGVPLTIAAPETPAIFYPQGGWVCPQALTHAVLDEALATGLLQIHYEAEVTALRHHENHWWLTVGDQEQGPIRNLVIAAGHRLGDFEPTAELPINPIRGQVSHLQSQPPLDQLACVLCYAGYLTPADTAQSHCLGASYQRGELQLAYQPSEQQENLDKLQLSLPNNEWPRHLQRGSEARIAIRCATRDHLPMAGEAPDVQQLKQRLQTQSHLWQQESAPRHPGLWVLGALGSHGLCSAPLLAEIMACELCAEPLPLSIEQLERLHPARSWLRPALRQQGSLAT